MIQNLDVKIIRNMYYWIGLCILTFYVENKIKYTHNNNYYLYTLDFYRIIYTPEYNYSITIHAIHVC